MPTMRGKNQLEAASGTMPRCENTKPNRAASLAMRISIASCMVTPMPTAEPFTAAMTGFRHLKMRSVTWPPPRVTVKGVGAGGQVSAGAEGAALTGDDDGADIVVPVGGVEGSDQFLL